MTNNTLIKSNVYVSWYSLFFYIIFLLLQSEQKTQRNRKAWNYALLSTTQNDSNSLSINKTKEILWLAINNLQDLTIESLILGWSSRVSHSTEASNNFINTIWTKGQLQGFIRKSLSWNSIVVIKFPLVCNLIEKEVYCRHVPLNKLNFLKELFYEHSQTGSLRNDIFCVTVKSNSLNESWWRNIILFKTAISIKILHYYHHKIINNFWCHYARFEKVTELCHK